MNYAVLDISFRKYSLYRLREACQIIGAGNENIFNASVTQAIKYACPELSAFIFAYPHSENILPAVHINAYGYIDSFLDDLSFAADMIMDSVKKDNCIDAFKRSLLPFFGYWENLVGDAADSGIRYLQTINITDMILNIRRRHSLCVHGDDLVLHILRYACLILRQYLRLKFAVSVTGDFDIHFTHTGTQSFLAVTVTAIVSFLVLHVIRLITKLRIKF